MLSLTDWSLDRPQTLPSADEVHLWQIDLDRTLEPQLSTDEQQRADAIRLHQVQQRFIHGRTALRSILEHYLKQPAIELKFEYGEHGRPSLLNVNTAIDFNLTHSGKTALLAITSTPGIGIDIELLRPQKNLLAIARKKFNPLQLEQLEACSENDRIELFFKFWTLMEAHLKAEGSSIFRYQKQNTDQGSSCSFLLSPDRIASLHRLTGPVDHLHTFLFTRQTPDIAHS